MTVINRDIVSHHANWLLLAVAEDDTCPFVPAGDVKVVDGETGPLAGFRVVDSDGVPWVLSVQPLPQDQAAGK